MSGEMTWMPGWAGPLEKGKRPHGVHHLALVGAPPESREWMVGDTFFEPEIGFGAFVDAFCTVDAGMPGLPTTRVGNRSWLQKRVHVGHNARIGVDCEICVGTVIGGEVLVGNGVKIGGNSWLKPQIRIGDGAIIGGGSVVTKDVPAHEVWAGNPARYLKIAWTHPDYVAQKDMLDANRARNDQYSMTEREWELAEIAIERRASLRSEIEEHVGYGAEDWRTRELSVEAARSGVVEGALREFRGLGHGVDGDFA